MSKQLPRPKGSALVALLHMGRDPLRHPVHCFDELGDTFALPLFGDLYVVSRDPALFEDVLVRHNKLFIKDVLTRGLSRLLGQGLLTSEHETWRKHRRILSPHFQAAEIERYLPVFREEAERELARWSPGTSIDLHRAMARMSMRIALRTVFGTESEDVEDFQASMRDAMLFFTGFAGTGITLPLALPSPSNRRFLRARGHLNDSVRRLLDGARARGAGNSVLQSLLTAREGGDLSEQQLVDESITMLIAGHETSALALAYTLALLADCPAEQRAIQEELGGNVPQTLDALRDASGLNRALKESLRLYPASWAVGREALEACNVAGIDIPRGAQVFLHQWAAQRHPRWISAPERFEPARWTPQFESTLPRGLYVPFGAGPRICIGNHFAIAEVLVGLAVFLQRFDFDAPRPFDASFTPSVTLRPRGPVLVTPRERSPVRRSLASAPLAAPNASSPT